MWNPFSNNWFYDEGTEWIGKGRWFMPVPGDPNRKKTNTRLFIVCICILFVALLGLSIWLGMPDYTYKKLPKFDMLIGTMGWKAADVAPFIGVDPANMPEISDGTYEVPEGEIYAGMAFETKLHFDDGLLSGFEYTYGAPVNIKKAAKNIANVAEMFMIESMFTAEKTEAQMNEVLLRQYFEQFAENKQTFMVTDIMDWTPEEHAYQSAVAKYLRMLESDPDWEGRVGAYLVKDACFYRQIDMSYNPDTQWVSIQLQFFVDMEKEW
jgi:hypothetical protein